MPRHDKLSPWWKEPKGACHEAVVSTIQALDNNQQERYAQNLHHLRLYSNRVAMGLYGGDWAVYDQSDKLKLNIVKAIIDAATAQISTNQTRPMFLTEKGNDKMQKRGKALAKFSLGQFHACRQYEIGLDVFRDAEIFSTGFEKVYAYQCEVRCERTFPNEIVVDDLECRYSEPRTMFQIKEVSREVLEENYPKFKQEIATAGDIRESSLSSTEERNKPIHVAEGWHLPSCKKAKDGRHVIVINNATLVDEPWTRPRFPFAKFSWSTAPIGYFGVGLAEELCSIQIEINYILQKIQKLMTLATSQVWVEKGSEINTGSLNNDDMVARSFKGRPPVFMTVASVSPEYFSQLDRLWNRAFEVSGVSQMAATAQLPAGLDSGKAIRTYADQTSKRFRHIEQRWEQFQLDVADLMIEAAREIEEKDGEYKVKTMSRNGIEELRFKDVDLDRDKYVLRAHPVSFLPDTPAGKMQTIKEFGEISPDFQKNLISLLEYPDLEAAVSLFNAPTELADLVIDLMLDKGEPVTPEPLWPLEEMIQRANLAAMKAKVSNVDDSKIELLRQFIADCDELLKPQQPQQAAAMPAQQGAPMPEQPSPEMMQGMMPQ